MLKDFKAFIDRGNLLQLAVAFIMGVTFAAVVTSLVNDIIMPPLGMIMGKMDFSSLAIHLNEKTAIKYGVFINHILDFVIVAFAIFMVIKQINRLKKAPPPADPTTKDCPKCCTAIPIKASRCPHCTSELAG